MESTQHLTEGTNENPSRHKGYMEQTQNSRLNPMSQIMTFNCDLETAWSSHGFMKSVHEVDMEKTLKTRLNHMTLKL